VRFIPFIFSGGPSSPVKETLNASDFLFHIVYFDIPAFILISLIDRISQLSVKIYILIAFGSYKQFEALRSIISFDSLHKGRANTQILSIRVDSQAANVTNAVFFVRPDGADHLSAGNSLQEYVSLELVYNLFNRLCEGRNIVIIISFGFALISKLL
jgi:hypothetical protein